MLKNHLKEESISRSDVDHLVLDIELVLISVIQGVALTTLSISAVDPLIKLQMQYWPYIFSAFLIILIFWSQAIIHALSFIKWPLNIWHTFFYFLTSFLEVLAFGQVTHPLFWSIFIFLFFIVTGMLYSIDLQLIKHSSDLFKSKARKELFNHILKRQIVEFRLLIPAGLVFNALAIFLLAQYRYFFIDRQWHIILASLQIVFTFIVLITTVKSFTKRSELITNCVENK